MRKYTDSTQTEKLTLVQTSSSSSLALAAWRTKKKSISREKAESNGWPSPDFRSPKVSARLHFWLLRLFPRPISLFMSVYISVYNSWRATTAGPRASSSRTAISRASVKVHIPFTSRWRGKSARQKKIQPSPLPPSRPVFRVVGLTLLVHSLSYSFSSTCFFSFCYSTLTAPVSSSSLWSSSYFASTLGRLDTSATLFFLQPQILTFFLNWFQNKT